ncbi:Protein of uncharacterised function (DUF2496) [Yersinia similis]|nr:Protein of uncharacterised function (DUF2496) [Yersinia similis]CNE39110.1 Protein of uncharacterised function (DUF2496) [Yersinia similis]
MNYCSAPLLSLIETLNIGHIMSVEQAPPELQLAVDLIYLLECNEIAPETALAALAIVQLDYQRKLRHKESD